MAIKHNKWFDIGKMCDMNYVRWMFNLFNHSITGDLLSIILTCVFKSL